MRIINTPEVKLQKDAIRQIANIGCDKCPCCGETTAFIEYLQKGVSDKGISAGISKEWVEDKLFNAKTMHADCYSCLTCGAEWESEPYSY